MNNISVEMTQDEASSIVALCALSGQKKLLSEENQKGLDKFAVNVITQVMQGGAKKSALFDEKDFRVINELSLLYTKVADFGYVERNKSLEAGQRVLLLKILEAVK